MRPNEVAGTTREPVVMVLGRGWVRLAYEGVMIALALLVAALLVLPDEGWFDITNLVIWIVFVIDYFVRLSLSTDRRAYVRKNIPDLIAIIPLDFLRLARLARLARLVRLLRAGVVLWRVSEDFRGILRENGLRWVLLAAAGTVCTGAVAVWAAEPAIESFGDAVWWSVVTSTTVGYGDIAPSTLTARAVAILIMLVGIGTIGMITGSVATYFVSESRRANPQLGFIRDELDRWDELDAVERRRVAAMLIALAELADGEEAPATRENADGGSHR